MTKHNNNSVLLKNSWLSTSACAGSISQTVIFYFWSTKKQTVKLTAENHNTSWQLVHNRRCKVLILRFVWATLRNKLSSSHASHWIDLQTVFITSFCGNPPSQALSLNHTFACLRVLCVVAPPDGSFIHHCIMCLCLQEVWWRVIVCQYVLVS